MATSIELDDDGRLLFVRRAHEALDVARLRREVSVLERLDHPGTVTLVGVRPNEGSGFAVATAFVGGGSLAEHRATGPAVAAALMATVADTVAHAHTLGISHGDLCADRVLLDAGGRPFVAGWGAFDADDPSAPTAADDVLALGSLLRALVRDGSGQPTELQALAARAAAPDRTARPTAATFATALRAATEVPPDRPRGRRVVARAVQPTDPSAPGLTLPLRRSAVPRRHLRPAQLAATTVLVGIVVGGGLGVLGRFQTGRSDALPAGSAPTMEGPVTSAPPSTSSGDGTERPASGGDTDPDIPWTPVDAGRCVPVTGAADDRPGPTGRCQRPGIDRGIVTLGETRWEVGEADDLVVLGRWDCSDTPTPAVVRPATGEVWVFPRWATADDEVPARSVAELGGAARVVPLDTDADGCHEIGVIRTDGTRVVVDPRADGA